MIFTGKYVTGCGEAHKYGADHVPAFGCPMVGTFNVQVPGCNLWKIPAARETTTDCRRWYWLVKLDDHYYAWALRWDGSHLPMTTLELLSKRPLPDSLKRDDLKVEVLERWSEGQIRDWGRSQYQFQGFDWLETKRVDSQMVWDTIQPHAKWAGADVLDVGSHYGYHSFKASRAGANVVAVEPDDGTRANAVTINDHIEMCDVEFVRANPAVDPDVTLYLSVHHQWEPEYKHLAETVEHHASHARQAVFVEVILPPMFGKGMTEAQVDAAVGGVPLLTYQHKVRGTRRIYRVEGRA
jgi:hypothetical protein